MKNHSGKLCSFKVVYSYHLGSTESLQKLINEKNKNLDIFKVFYSFNKQVEYQDYILVLDAVYNSIIDLRKNYLNEKYNIDYYSKNYENKELIKESKRRYPLFFASARIIK